MRSRGGRFECLRMRPHDHIGWVFAGPAEFAALARPFLAEGAALGEKLMYVAADPDPADVAGLASPDALQIASIAEVYGSSGIVDAPSQQATFTVALVHALAEGYTGIRVAADNTPLVTGEARLQAWTQWEIVADRFMSQNPVTGLCAFDREKVDVDRLRHLATLHPLSPADDPVPQFRMFADAGDLWIEGEIDTFAVSQLRLALKFLPPRTGVHIDLAAATLRGRRAVTDLGHLAGAGVPVTIRGEPAAIGQLRAPGPAISEHLILQEAAPMIGAAGWARAVPG
jgi:MEDS: MEthanogen/methylotroph, DcmR Sensory domain